MCQVDRVYVEKGELDFEEMAVLLERKDGGSEEAEVAEQTQVDLDEQLKGKEKEDEDQVASC